MKIRELHESDPFKGIKDFAANFKKGAEEVTGKSSTRQSVTQKTNPLDRYSSQDLQNMFSKILNKKELAGHEIKIIQRLHKHYSNL